MSIRPTEINLHKQSRILEITFEDGARFHLPAEYLRVYSPSAEVQGHGPGEGVLQIGKEDVNIDNIVAVGNYAVQLYFDDNHNTGIYSWATLYELGANQAEYWQEYLQKLEAAGHKHSALKQH
jgi:DUF971 family protein